MLRDIINIDASNIPMENVITVAKSGGDFDSIQAAIDYAIITYPLKAEDNPVVITVAPGVYTEQIIGEPYVIIKSVAGAYDPVFGRAKATLRNVGNAPGNYPLRTNATIDEYFIIGMTIETTTENGIYGTFPSGSFNNCYFTGGHFTETIDSNYVAFKDCNFANDIYGGFYLVGDGLAGNRNMNMYNTRLRGAPVFTSTHTGWSYTTLRTVEIKGYVTNAGDWGFDGRDLFTHGEVERNSFDNTYEVLITNSRMWNGVHFISDIPRVVFSTNNFEGNSENEIADGEADVTSDVIITDVAFSNCIMHNGLSGNIQITNAVKTVGTSIDAYITIQDAINSLTTSGQTISVYPKIYNESLTFSQNDTSILGQQASGGQHAVILSQASSNVIDFGNTVRCVVSNCNIQVTGATSEIHAVKVGPTGFGKIRFSRTELICSSGGILSSVGYSDGGVLTFAHGKIYQTNNVVGSGTEIKSAFRVAAGGTINLLDVKDIGITTGGLSNYSVVGSDEGTSGTILSKRSGITINDEDASHTGLLYLTGSSLDHNIEFNEISINDGITNSGQSCGICNPSGTINVHSCFNHLHVSPVVGTAYSFVLSSTSTATSHFDDLIAAEGSLIAEGGVYNYVNSPNNGDLQISGNYINMYSNQKTVGGRGQDFTTIQAAIDNITDASSDKEYNILVYPGIYNENVDLTGKPYISLAAAGSTANTTISSSSGTTLTTSNGSSFTISNMSIETTGGKAIHVPSGTGYNDIFFNTCVIRGTYSSTYKDLIELESGIIYFIGVQLLYLQSGTGGGTHRAIYLNGPSNVVMSTTEIYMNIASVGDDVIAMDETNELITTKVNGCTVELIRNGSVTGETTCYAASGTSDLKDWQSNQIHLHNEGTGGTAQIYKSYNYGCEIHSVGNKLKVKDFTNNHLGNILEHDSLFSHFDDIITLDGKTGAGLYEYVNSPSDGDIQISGSYLNMYDQALTVGTRGADHTSIQDAIDAITDASPSKRYSLLLYPGNYVENVDLTGKPYIDIKAVSVRSSTHLTSSSGTTLILSDQNTIINDVKITSTGGKIFEVPAVSTLIKYRFAGCSFGSVLNNTFADSIEIKGGDVQITRSFLNYVHTGTGGGTHRLVNITGPAIFTSLTTEMKMVVDNAVSDDVIGIEEANEVITTTVNSSKLDIRRNGIVTGDTIGYYANGTGSDKLFQASSILLLNNGSGGDASIIKTAGSGCTTTLQSNILKSLNFTDNHLATIGTGDTVYSNFDTITAAEELNPISTGELIAIHAHSIGDFFVNRDILLSRSIEIGGNLSLTTGPYVNEITTSISSPGSDNVLPTEKAIVEHTNTLTNFYIKKDGTTAFTGPVSGVTPLLGSQLATKEYADSIGGSGGTNDVGPFISASLLTPPGGETPGDKYIIEGDSTSAASGVWLEHENDIATAVDSTGTITWTFETPVAGNHGWVTDEGQDHTFDGTSWQPTGTLIDHITIKNIGINSHSNIDSHIANITTNPHVVTKTNVGLSDVTNDAQLKRSANDFNAFGSKSNVVVNDRILIEDSDDSLAKKYVLANDMIDRHLKISATDTTQDYLMNKLIGTTDKITLSQLGVGGDEGLQIGVGTDVTSAITHVSSDGKSHSDVVLNNTHRSSDGKNHSDVVANNAARHSESHTIVSHSDTTATGAELETLTNGSSADSLHHHTIEGMPDGGTWELVTALVVNGQVVDFVDNIKVDKIYSRTEASAYIEMDGETISIYSDWKNLLHMDGDNEEIVVNPHADSVAVDFMIKGSDGAAGIENAYKYDYALRKHTFLQDVALTTGVAVNEISNTSSTNSSTSLLTSEAIHDLTGWHGSSTRIKIGAAEFFPNDDEDWKQRIENDGGSITDSSGKTTEFITSSIYIPEGFKATAYMVYSSANIAIEIFENNITNNTGITKGTGNANTEVDMTDVISSTSNYLSIVVVEAGADIYGAYVTIEKV